MCNFNNFLTALFSTICVICENTDCCIKSVLCCYHVKRCKKYALSCASHPLNSKKDSSYYSASGSTTLPCWSLIQICPNQSKTSTVDNRLSTVVHNYLFFNSLRICVKSLADSTNRPNPQCLLGVSFSVDNSRRQRSFSTPSAEELKSL